MKKRLLALLLITVVTIMPFLYSCAEKANETQTDQSSVDEGNQTSAEATQTATNPRVEPDLPDDVNYNGSDFTFLCARYENIADWVSFDPLEIIAEKETGEPINDAVYRRNTKIEDQYGIKIKMITSNDEVALLRKAVNAGDIIYDAAVIFNNRISSTVSGGLLLELGKLPYIDIDKPWWDKSAKSMSIAGKNYLLAGDLTILDNNIRTRASV